MTVEPWLHIEIHDSDIGIIRYGPSGNGSGLAFVGITPRIYFEDPTASPPTDPDREALGLAGWAEGAVGRDFDALRSAIRPYLAEDVESECDASDDDELDDSDIFVEVKAARLLTTLGMTPPAWE